MSAGRKTKVAVLGGGAGAMAAAFELLRTPERRQALDVTIYQMGWRLGGKGASGRNQKRGQRIEEHGLHLWFGFYDNAFRVMGDAYATVDRPSTAPLATLWKAFAPCHQIVLYDQYDGQWSSEYFDVPTDDRKPGHSRPTKVLPGPIIHKTVRYLDGRWRSGAGGALGLMVEAVDTVFDEVQTHTARRRDGQDLVAHGIDEAIAEALKVARALVWHHVKDHLDHPEARHFFQLLDIVASAWCGIVAERVFERGFSVIDDRDFQRWLAQHGASAITVGTGDQGAGALRGFYDLVFAYADGDTAQPDLAAGRALQALLKIGFDFKGSIMWRMQAGMGDVVFGPFYEALVKLGADVQFFHRVTGLRLNAAGTAVDAVDLVRQAEVVHPPYQPLYPVNGLPSWPNQPLWEQLVDGPALADAGVDFEVPCPLPGDVPVTLEAGRDFDVVVLAIPTPAHRELCAELIAANAGYAAMVDSHRSAATQAFQVWSTATEPDLGWPFPVEAVASAYVEPLDTLCPMPQLLAREDWPKGAVNSIWYACGVLADAEPWRCGGDDRRTEAERNAVAWLQDDAAVPWPKASVDGSFDWRLLAGPGDDRTGPARFASQYWRANVTPSERYVRTPPKSVEKRLWPGASGFANLALAGDWTRNFIDGGCVEAAVISGLLAARFVLGEAGIADAAVTIDGENTWLLED
jgi:uncharacterized protein with NAD-binding domain and iron-sulfur cluster